MSVLAILPLSLRRLLLAIPCLTLAGCLLPAERQEELLPTTHSRYANTVVAKSSYPETKGRPSETSASSTPPPSPNDAPPTPDWWVAYGSSELNHLVDRGLSHNADIRIALSRITQLKARYTQASAGRKPSISAPIAAANQAPGSTAVGAAPSSQQTTGSSGSSSSNRLSSQKTFQASIRADWRLDLWGEQAALADAAEFQLQKAVHERANVERNLIANIVANYIEHLSLNDRLRIANETERIFQATLEILEKRLQMGDASISEVEQQRASIFSLQATIPTLEHQRLEALNGLAMLIGATPGELVLSDLGLDSLTLPANSVPTFTALSLFQRPDIKAAEAQLLAAKADIDVARARLLPTLDLSAQSGSSSMTAQNLFSAGTLFWNVVANLGINLFDGGRKKGDQQFSSAVKEEMLETYVKTIHQALRETENAKSAIYQAERRTNAHRAATNAAKKAWDINRKIFELGALDYASLLDTQRSYNRYLDDFQRTRADLLKSQIPILQLQGHSFPTHQPLEIPELLQQDTYWQVELDNAFHQSAVQPLQRDLSKRFPNAMDGRMIRPKELSYIDYKTTGKQAWYQVAVAPFQTAQEALDFCETLQPEQRCRVISSSSDKTVTAADLPK